MTWIRQNTEQKILLIQLRNNLKEERYFQLLWASVQKSMYPGRKIEPGKQTAFLMRLQVLPIDVI